jgi:hypothetical protein
MDASALPYAAAEFGVSEVVESLATGESTFYPKNVKNKMLPRTMLMHYFS